MNIGITVFSLKHRLESWSQSSRVSVIAVCFQSSHRLKYEKEVSLEQ